MRLIQLLFLIFFTSFTYAQSKEVEIIKTEKSNEVTYYAKSITKETVIIEFEVTGSGFTTNVSTPSKIELKGFEKKEVIKITTGSTASYSVSYKISKPGASGLSASTAPMVDRPELNKGIVIFSKDGCTKCDYAKSILKEKGKAYTVLNISTNENDQRLMWNKLKTSGFSGGTVQTPVIMIDGKLHYNMDIKLFMAEIK